MKERGFAGILSSLALLGFLLAGCEEVPAESVSSSLPTPVGELQDIFYRLRENNFSIAYQDRYASNNQIRYQDSRYTAYSIESEGDFGFNGYAQGDGHIFAYTIEDGEIVSGAPYTSSYTGMRYENLYDLREGFGEFDYTALPTTVNEEGVYVYEFGVNSTNDMLLEAILLRRTYNAASHPSSFTMSVNGGTLSFEAVMLVYEEQNDQDTAEGTVYSIGSTVNPEIRDYLNGGGSSKKPLDSRFYRLIAPYIDRNNFKTHLDATEYTTTAAYSTFQMDQYFLDNALLYDRLDDNSTAVNGQLDTGYAVANFTMDSIDDDRLEITGTVNDTDGEFISGIYTDYLTYSMTSLNFTDFVGYIDEENEDSYILTDDYLHYILSYVCYFDIDSQSNSVERLRLEVNDWESKKFTLHFEMINRTTNRSLGTYHCTFSDPGEVSFAAIDRYLAIGNDGSTTDISTLESVLTKFSAHNYSMDLMTGSGIAKAYFTEDYYYVEVYGNPSQNYGYVKEGESIYGFTLSYDANGNPTAMDVATGTDYAAGTSPMSLPGCGTYQGASNDLGYISAFSDAIYDYDSYVLAECMGYVYFRNSTSGFGQSALDYYYPSQTTALPYGAGFMVQDGNDPYDVRVTFFVSFVSNDGTQYGAISETFYDIGNTHHAYIESQLEAM